MEELDRDGDGHLDDRNCVRRDHESQAARGQRTQDRDDTDSRHSAGVSWSTVNSSPSDEDRAGAQLATDRSAAKTPAGEAVSISLCKLARPRRFPDCLLRQDARANALPDTYFLLTTGECETKGVRTDTHIHVHTHTRTLPHTHTQIN